MVKVTEVHEDELSRKQQQQPQQQQQQESFDLDDEYEQISDDDLDGVSVVRTRSKFPDDNAEEGEEAENEEEGLYERILALREMVPYKTRRRISQGLSALFTNGWGLAYITGRLAWSFCTTAFLFGLPALYSQTMDEMFAQMEQQARMQGAGAGMGMVPPTPSGPVAPPSFQK